MPVRAKVYHQLFVGAEPDGRLTITNKLLIVAILLAVTSAVLFTEPSLKREVHDALRIGEVVFGAIFLVEYCARIYAAAECPGEGSAAAKRWAFIRSPLGLIDLFVVVATLMPMLTADAAMLRVLRLVRVLAVMKFGRFNHAMREVWAAITDRADDLIVTITLAAIVVLLGATALYVIEGEIQPEEFGSIPRSLYWAVMTLTTVGYGDSYPITALGKLFAALVALAGIALVAMPTGIIAAAFSEAMQRRRDHRIEDMRAHLARLDEIDEDVAAKLAALERTSHPKP